MNSAKTNWGIIGGGILGMSLAHKLMQKGNNVTIFDSGSQLGGLTTPWNLNGITWDRFYHVILLSDSYTRTLLKELDLEKEINWVETKTGFYTDGQLVSMSNSLEFLRFPPINLIDKIRLGATIFYASKVKNWKHLETILVTDWLKKLSGNNTFEKIWLPLLRSKLGDTYSKASAAFIWATIQRMYAARKSGLKKEMFGYVSGGYKKILDKFVHLLENEKVNIKINHVAKIVKTTTGNKIFIEFENGYQETFDHVIMTLPSPIISKICPELTEVEKKRLEGIQYLGVVCASVLLKKPLSKFYVTNITDNGYPFTGVIEMSALVDPINFNGNSLIYLPKYVTPDDPYLHMNDEEIKNKFLLSLLKMYPTLKEEDILCFKVSRAKYVFALSTINYSDLLPSMISSIPGLYFINNSYISNGTLNVNETLQLADSAMHHITN
jgi:protoporphyrinogen oxidase